MVGDLSAWRLTSKRESAQVLDSNKVGESPIDGGGPVWYAGHAAGETGEYRNNEERI